MIASPIAHQIKQKIECKGKKIKDWDISIFRGILTGFNEAFIICADKRDELITADPKSTELIKPILRGRDIKRYQSQFADLYVLFIPWHFPLNQDKLIQGASIAAENAFKKEYPAVYQHLYSYKESLSARNKSETGIRYEWYALQRCAATYYEEFQKEKIIYQEIVQESSFSYSAETEIFCLDTGRIITGKNLKFINAILNSKTFFYAIKLFYGGGGLGSKGVRMKHTFFEDFKIPELSIDQQAPFITLVERILATKTENPQADTSLLENEIDQMVYALYGLNDEEIALIEAQVNGVASEC